MVETYDNMAERQANRLTAPVCAILAVTPYGRTVVVLTDDGHATTFLPYSTSTKGSELTLLHVNRNHWRAAEITPDIALLPIDTIWEHHLSLDPRGFWVPHFYSRCARWKPFI